MSRFRWKAALKTLALAWLLVLVPGAVTAQSLSSGVLTGTVTHEDGSLFRGAQVTLERADGTTIFTAESDVLGRFRFGPLNPGLYRVLVEQIGYQPIRRLAVRIGPGQTTAIRIPLIERPPPIDRVVEEVEAAAPSGQNPATGQSGASLARHARWWEATALSELSAEVVSSADARPGLGLAASGLPIRHSRFVVDGLQETALGHGDWPDEPVRSATFGRQGIGHVQVLGAPRDGEWRGAPGSTFNLLTDRGGNRATIRPYGAFGSSVGGRALDNPGDSTTTSFQLGAVMSGAIIPDTAHVFFRVDYQSLQLPAASSWERDEASFDGTAGSLAALLPALASDSFATSIDRYVRPPVRTWRGGTGTGRLDWRLAGQHALALRAGFASWKEANWPLANEGISGAGNELDGRDISAALTVTSAGLTQTNEFRLGVSLAKRDYQGPEFPGVALVSNGAAFGGSAGYPALFERTTVDISDAFQAALGRHRIKFGVSATLSRHVQDYRFGSGGSFLFGSLDEFGLGRGAYARVAGPDEVARFTIADLGGFIQDSWSATPELDILLGLRYDFQRLPGGETLANDGWFQASGLRTDSLFPRDRSGLSPRLGFIWTGRGSIVLRGGAGIHVGGLDPSRYAEALLFDRGVEVYRGLGVFPDWPGRPGVAEAPVAGERITLLSPNYRAPRTGKLDLGLSQQVSGLVFDIGAAYHHTDYVLRRDDLNRLLAPSATDVDGRLIFGQLVQQGALVAAVPGSNRRFTSFDLVSGLAPTGFVDYYELAASLERTVDRGVSFRLGYTFSKTTDNLIGARSPDPADQISPFPIDQGEPDWAEGRSDYDAPHRLVAQAGVRSGGRTPIGVFARYRFRSGLPFTPGFRPGVDANGDGSYANDPAFLGTGVPGAAEAFSGGRCDGSLNGSFAARNTCRGPSYQALDLALEIGLPMAGGRRLMFTADAFGVIASEVGIVDRALVLVDPDGAITTPGGRVQLPLMANPNFGSLLVRRTEPRSLRVGLRLEY